MLAEHVEYGQCLQGYRLVRRHRGDKPVVALGTPYGEFGFECVNQAKYRAWTRRYQAAGNHVVVVGHINRHPMYELADEYWGACAYKGNICPKGMLQSVFGNHVYETPPVGSDSEGDLIILEASPKAKERAAEIAKDGPFILTMPRYRAEEQSRNFCRWPALTEQLKETYPDHRIIACTIRGTCFDTCSEYLQDLVGLEDMLDVECELHKLAKFTLSGDSGCNLVPILCGSKQLVFFNGIFPMHDAVYNMMLARFPGYCQLHLADFTHHYQPGKEDQILTNVMRYLKEHFKPQA